MAEAREDNVGLQRASLGRALRPWAAVLCVAITGALCASPAAGRSVLARRLNALLSDPELANARVGVEVAAIATGRILYRRGATERFIAASNEKLVTATAALFALGRDYEFVTRLYATGPLKGPEFDGDLVLRGGGDPTIGGRYDEQSAAEVFGAWARRLSERGLRVVKGDIVADDTFFDRQYRHPSWSKYPPWKWYYTGVSALAVNDNCALVTVRPGASSGDPAEIDVSPPSAALPVLNLCKTHPEKHAIWFERQPGAAATKVGGYVRLGTSGYSQYVALPDPSLYAPAVLRQALAEQGIRLDGTVRLVRGGERLDYGRFVLLCERRTPLLPVLGTMLRRSHNHYAEQVIKTVGAETWGTGSWRGGIARAEQVLEQMGFHRGEFRLDDGSGLSRRNELSPALIVSLLLQMSREPYGALFPSLLAESGGEGTLKNRLTEPPYRGNVRAKTGYLNGVGALSGYAACRTGIKVAFCIMINDDRSPPGSYSMRQKLDGICRAIVDFAE